LFELLRNAPTASDLMPAQADTGIEEIYHFYLLKKNNPMTSDQLKDLKARTEALRRYL
jgi:hypothetical protein